MALEIIRDAPSRDQFTSLEEHQAQTPGTFFGGKAVLHYHSGDVKLSLERQHLESQPALSNLRSNTPQVNAANGEAEAQEQVEIPGIDIWVTSEYFILFSPTTSSGVQIPYPTISLHAQQQSALYMQLCLSDTSQTADEDLETLELLLTPPAASQHAEPAETSQTPIQALYAAVSACADLHPDPDESDEGEQEPLPGAGGWITSENMHEFFDEEGNLREGVAMFGGEGADGGTGLGAGAGTVRTADEFEDAVDGLEEPGTEETKWRRTG